MERNELFAAGLNHHDRDTTKARLLLNRLQDVDASLTALDAMDNPPEDAKTVRNEQEALRQTTYDALTQLPLGEVKLILEEQERQTRS